MGEVCTPWVTGDDVASCCAEISSSSSSGSGSGATFGWAADAASDILYELSGRQYPGVCQVSVRPCQDPRRCGCWTQFIGGSTVIPGDWSTGWGFSDTTGRWRREYGPECGCHPLSRVKLAGYPVIEIVEVKIDGSVVSSSGYRLDEDRWLTRLGDPANGNARRWWPGCQRLDLPNTEAGTFSVEYRYGEQPPVAGSRAARELACQLALACLGDEACVLPQGVTRVVRQGVTIERAVLDLFGQGRTGLIMVDAFLGASNPAGINRRAAVFSPDVQQYARPVLEPEP